MKRFNFYLSLTFCFVTLALNAQFDYYKVEKSLSTLGLKGNISSFENLTRTIHVWKDKSIDTSKWLQNIHKFDKNGNCTEHIEYTYKSTGKKDTIVKKKGIVTEILVKDIEDTVRTSHVIYRYDDHQRPIEKAYYGENKKLRSQHLISYTYDSEGRILVAESIFTGSDGKVSKFKKSFEYLEGGDFKCEHYSYDEDKSYGWRLYNQYGVSLEYRFARTGTTDSRGGKNWEKTDERGNVIEESYEKSDTTWYTRYYTFDKNGNKTERRDESFNKKNNSLDKFIFDENNNQIRHESYDYKNKPVQLFISEYDSHNNQTKTIFHKTGKWNKVDFVINYVYTYDSNGNWIEKHKNPTTKNLSKHIDTRKIIYY